ncbi:MAG: hypothetical protein G01um101416_1047 [Microgenomates group bacterium Gr01-1014_16]|nr:MAG: hypothetical protein G01um101416_1047 [Microgenomates group bacterium Gr01-1014_16]
MSSKAESRSVIKWLVESVEEFGAGLSGRRVVKNKIPVRADMVDVAIGAGLVVGGALVCNGLIWMGWVWAGG